MNYPICQYNIRKLTDEERDDSGDIERLIGKTIKAVEPLGIKGHDDVPYLLIYFTDGSRAMMEGSYGGYTGKSEDEYIRFIGVTWVE